MSSIENFNFFIKNYPIIGIANKCNWKFELKLNGLANVIVYWRIFHSEIIYWLLHLLFNPNLSVHWILWYVGSLVYFRMRVTS